MVVNLEKHGGIKGVKELEAYQFWTGSPDEPTSTQAMAGEDREERTFQKHRGETFSTTARISSLTMFNIIAHVKGYRRIQFDVNSFNLVVTSPRFFRSSCRSVPHRLRKYLYGLRQLGREWDTHAAMVYQSGRSKIL
ncbi:BZ3500_MvSof-1268-A1-R1_Chr4-3g07358 [Microbotryum saponariae]|uniref:BZ3500_MvSof-1268-A1-R1_Chr4-3g07358 protein n=1 Tax=Microbotryum saponariae TaxID=289078 RepID=A0A2X0LIY4_9BASI|nr:BZ3500_MvSof-1268-A1-R1_Chr4-3g07358 [Microbotryum saponariae]SDA07021.1 BZ3501_MvSof-1269-A2-R1_Chr4-2g07067 [Microbotryum saponariae]